MTTTTTIFLGCDSIEINLVFLQNHYKTENEIINFLLHHRQKILSNMYKSAENFRKSQQKFFIKKRKKTLIYFDPPSISQETTRTLKSPYQTQENSRQLLGTPAS